MENLKAFFTRRPERLLGRCGMLFLMAFFVMNLSSCNDDFIECIFRRIPVQYFR